MPGTGSQVRAKLEEDIYVKINDLSVSAALSISVWGVCRVHVFCLPNMKNHRRLCSIGDNLPHSWPTHCHVRYIIKHKYIPMNIPFSFLKAVHWSKHVMLVNISLRYIINRSMFVQPEVISFRDSPPKKKKNRTDPYNALYLHIVIACSEKRNPAKKKQAFQYEVVPTLKVKDHRPLHKSKS